MSRAIFVTLTLVLAAADRAGAQSLFGAGGLGTPVQAVDARARGLGGIAAGLFGPTLFPSDPAGAAAVVLPAATASLLPTWVHSDLGGEGSDGQTTRFPLVAVAYPVSPASVVSVSYGAFLDMRWTLRQSGTELFGSSEVAVEDQFQSEGGVATFKLGWAQRLTPSLAVGASAGVYTGSLMRTFARAVGAGTAETPVDSISRRGDWSLTGRVLTLGANWDPTPIVRIAGSVTWSSDLDAAPAEGSATQTRGKFRLPIEVVAGASARLTPQITTSAGFSWADWSSTDRDVSDGNAGVAWSAALGLEVRGLLGSSPLRLGYRRSQLPFGIEGEAPSEGALTGGLGLTLLEVEGTPLARMDFALERGSRQATRLEESFWRAAFTIFLSGR